MPMDSDGSLIFDTAIDNSGFHRGVGQLNNIAAVALGNLANDIMQKVSAAAAQVPAQMVEVGSSFEAAMSQVAATSGITAASEEYGMLKAAAQEMGATTQFSATQAAEALNYLALAGYDAEKSIATLPTILNVAASDGMELAAASDMITDAMSALDLQMSEGDTFANKLAVAAQKSNASVSQMGEAILTVGGTAKDLSGGVTELTTMLGVLADNGIKGAEGGTALRNMILSLSAPTDTAAEALSNLSIDAFDANGNMRPLQDTFADLSAALSALSAEDRNQILSDIFNKVDLKSANALLGTSSERFKELAGYIDDCDGAAAQMAETMNDNLKGDITILQSGLEGLGIAAYDKFQLPMRSAVQDVTSSVDILTTSLTDGKLSDSFDKISVGFSDIASAATEILANDIIPAAINGLATIIEHGNEIIAIIGGIAAAVAVVNIVPVITKAVAAITMANKALVLLSAETSVATFQQAALASGLTLTEVVVGLFTGKLTAATAAQALFGTTTAATTLTVIASTAALAALAAVTIGAALAFKKYVDEMETAAAVDPWLEQARANTSAIEKEKKSYEELIATRDKNIAADEAEANNINKLWTELKSYVDESGNVISNNERAAEIIGTLNNAYDLNISYIDGQIQGYGDLAKSMDDYIEKLRTEARIRNAQPAYDEAIKQQDAANSKRLQLEKELNDKIAAFRAAENNDVKGVFAVQIGGIREEMALLDETITMYQSSIDEYENLFTNAFDTGRVASAAEMSAREVADRVKAANETAAQELTESQKKATEKLAENWEQLEHDYKSGNISSEAELYAKKQEAWNKYGDASLKDHWQYYEDLYDYDKSYGEKAQQLYDQQLSDEWDAIEHNKNLGFITDEQAYQKKLDFIQKYCPEYSDEWYDYYKSVADMQQEAEQEQLDTLKGSMSEQVDTVKDGLNDIIKAYKEDYNEIQSNIDSYRNKLLSVGEAFSVIEKKDGKKIFKVNDLRKQMAQMQNYASYIKQLRKSGASEGLISELTSMDFSEGATFAQGLSQLSAKEFEQVNKYYSERDKLAASLAEEYYQPEIDSLNSKLKMDVEGQFDELPEAIRATGADTVTAFIDGLQSGDLSGQVQTFCDSFVTACNEEIDKIDLSSSFDGIFEQDTFAMGQQLGNDFVSGFNAAMSELEAAVLAEQAKVSASLTTRTSAEQAKTETKSESKGDKDNRIVIENHLHAELDVDGEKMAETVIEKTETINRRRNK